VPTQPNWRTSTYTTNDTCVEVADNDPDTIMIRDTKDRRRRAVRVTPAAWAPFLQHVGRS
jgi:hypothetical protein